MTLVLAYFAALACSVCWGISTVQQKVGADLVKKIHRFDITFLLRLLKNKPYLAGIFLSIGGYGLLLFALRSLPLFLVQAISSSSIVVTAIGERIYLHKKMGRRSYTALAAVVVGLILLGLGAVSGHANVGSGSARQLVELLPIPIALIGVALIYTKGRSVAFTLAGLGGLAYGNTSTIGRIITYPHPYWKIVEQPLLWSLIGSALLGQYLFSVSLQRASATKSNSVMIVMQTLGPALCGLLFFDDKIRVGFLGVVILGGALMISGAIATALKEPVKLKTLPE
jgi:drug/metabolite transporter (DMT)-like permease